MRVFMLVLTLFACNIHKPSVVWKRGYFTLFTGKVDVVVYFILDLKP